MARARRRKPGGEGAASAALPGPGVGDEAARARAIYRERLGRTTALRVSSETLRLLSEAPNMRPFEGVITDNDLAEWFREAARPPRSDKESRLTIPDRETRDVVARSLHYPLIMLHAPHAGRFLPQAKRNPALKHARLLLQHLQDESERFNSTPGRTVLRRIEAAVRDVIRVLTPDRSRVHPEALQWRLCACLIAAAAQRAWYESSGRWVRSPNADDPLNTFVQLVFTKIEGRVVSKHTDCCCA